MTRIWWDSCPPYLKAVVGWWDRPDCSRRGATRERLAPWWMYAGLVIAMCIVDFCIVYILSSTGLPNAVSLWAWIGVCVVVVVAFNLLIGRAFTEWRRAPK